MGETQISEEILKKLQIIDITVQNVNSVDILVFISPNEDAANQLHHILKNNFKSLGVFIDEKTGNYNLNVELRNSEFSFGFNSTRNSTNYPPAAKLENGSIDSMTIGVFGETEENRRPVHINKDLIRLGSLDIGKSLGRAKEIQFITAIDDNPPAVILLFSNWDHILFAEADNAYEKLRPISIMEPKLEMNFLQSGLLELRIWDIATDLDVKLNGLQFTQAELDKFLQNVDAQDSFVFSLGFPPKSGTTAAIASTSRGEIDLIKLHGYVVKKS